MTKTKMNDLTIRHFAAATNEHLIHNQVKDDFRYIVNAPARSRWQHRDSAGRWHTTSKTAVRSMIQHMTGLDTTQTRIATLVLEQYAYRRVWPLPPLDELTAMLAQTVRWDAAAADDIWWVWYDRPWADTGCWGREGGTKYIRDYVIGARLGVQPGLRDLLPKDERQRRMALRRPIIERLKTAYAVTAKPTDAPPPHTSLESELVPA